MLETELGVLLLLLRELRDGTSDASSESESESESSEESSSCAAPKRAASCSTVGCENCSVVIWRVACGLVGFGDLIWDGESERPFGTSAELTRRE